MKPTEEQQGIIESDASVIGVNAFAGTGKTSTLVAYAKEHSHKKMLYLAFNKPVAMEAQKRFPSNVEARTSHSMAFPGFGSRYKEKFGTLKPYHVAKAVPALCRQLSTRDSMLFSIAVADTLSKFIASASKSVELSHVRFKNDLFDSNDIVEGAKGVWSAMTDTKNHTIPMPHDGYLKLWQLSSPNLARYDTIMLDEAQDTNGALFDAFAKAHTQKILVGDRHQGIYAFRGAMNAMSLIKGEQHYLTSSFRFGQEIGDVANGILSVFKDEDRRLSGLGAPSELRSHAHPNEETTFLHRTNAGLFGRAVDFYQRGRDFGFVGGFKNYNPDQIMDAYFLMTRNKYSIQDPFIKTFDTFDDMAAYAETANDKELKARIKVAAKYADKIPKLIEAITAIDEAYHGIHHETGTLLTTAHRSKGLEWNQVVLGEDFPTAFEKGAPLHSDYVDPDKCENELLTPDEANLIYVASTRAKKTLVPYENLREFINWYADENQRLTTILKPLINLEDTKKNVPLQNDPC